MAPPGVPRESYILTPNHDFTVVVYDTERDDLTDGQGNVKTEYVQTRAYEYKVSLAVLKRLKYFAVVFARKGSLDTNKHELMNDDDSAAWKLILQGHHDSFDASSYEGRPLALPRSFGPDRSLAS